MRCDELISKISEYLDGELSTEEKREFERHLSRCSSCAKELEQTKKTVELCHSLKELPLPEGFSQQLKERLRAQPAPQKRPMPLWLKDRRLYMGVAALAASFVLILGPFYTMYQNSNTPVEPAIPAVTQTPSEQGKVNDSEIENRGMQEETDLAQAVVPSNAPTPQVTPQAVQPTAAPQTAPSSQQEVPVEPKSSALLPVEPQQIEQAPQEEQSQVWNEVAVPAQSPQGEAAESVPEGLLQSPAPVTRADAAGERSARPSEKEAQEPEAEDALVFSTAMPTSIPEDSASGAKADNAALDSGGSGGGSSGSRPSSSSGAALGGGSSGAAAVAAQLSSVQVVAVKDTEAMQQLLKQQNAVKQKETEGYIVYQVEEDKLDLILTGAEEISYSEGYMDGVQEKEGFAYVILIQQ